MSDSGTIDITNVVEAMRSTFVSWGTQFVFATVIAQPYCAWLGLPVISSLFQAIITAILNVITKAGVMEAFFMNTAIRKASQAQDYIAAYNAKLALPLTATDKEYEDAEQNEMAKFHNFVVVTN